MKENKAVYVTSYNIREDQLYKDHQLYNSKGYRDYSPKRYENGTNDAGVQFNAYCMCEENISALKRRHQEVRYFSGETRHLYTYHGSRSFTDIGVGSIKAFQRKKIKRIYLPETDDRGVGSSDLLSHFSRRTRHNRGFSYNDHKKTTSKGVGGVIDGTVVVLHEKLSPIVHMQSKSTSPTDTAAEDQKQNVEIGSNTFKNNLVSTATQMDNNTKKEEAKIEVRKVIVSIEQGKEPLKQIVKEKICKDVPRKVEQKERILSKRAQEAERVFSSDSLVQHIHNLEVPSEGNHSHMSIDPMENKLEREYRKMFSTKSKESRDPKVEEEQLQFDLKSTSVLRRRFEALRRGLAKKEDSKKNAVVANNDSNNGSGELSQKDVSIASDPPSLEGRSFSHTKVHSPYPSSNRKVTSNPRQDFRRSVTGKKLWTSTEDEESDCQGVKAMFKLWGKKFNLENEEAGQLPKSSEERSEKPVKSPEPTLTIQDSENKKEGKKFFFFKKKSKDKPKQQHKQKKGVTAGRCEVGDGLMIKIGAGNSKPRTPAEKERVVSEGVPEEYEDMIRKAWLQQFMTRTIESRHSLNIRWNNNAYATSSSTILGIMENVHKDTGVIFRSRSEITTGESSSYKSYTKQRVNFVHDIEAWMIPNFLPDNITPIPTVNNDKSDEGHNNIQVRISDQKWIIDKSKAFAHKIEVVLHSRNVTKIQQDPSSEYLTIDIPKGFFTDSNTDSGGPIHTSNEEVYKIVEYESPESNTRLKKIKNFETGDNLKDIKVTVSIKNSCAVESKILETVIKAPPVHRDVVTQGSNVYIPKRCNVIGVGIITQKKIDRLRKPILKMQDDYTEEESDHSVHKSQFAESYLQDYYRHWTPVGMDFFSWCISDSLIQCCSDNSNPSVNNQGDGTKSCPNIYDDYQASTVVSSCGTSCCSRCIWEEEINTGLVSKLCNRFKAKNKCEPENPDKRVLPKDSVEVFRKRKLYAMSNKSNWTFDYERPYSVPSIESIGAQDTLIECPKLKKKARVTKKKFSKKHVSLPDCETMHDKLLQQINSSHPSGILNFKTSHCDTCEKINNPCPKHATVLPKPTAEVPPLSPPPSVPSSPQHKKAAPCKQSIKQVVIKPDSGESLQHRRKSQPLKSPCASPPYTPPKCRTTSPSSFTPPCQLDSPKQSQSSSDSPQKPQPNQISSIPPCDCPTKDKDQIPPCGFLLPSGICLRSPLSSQCNKSKPSSLKKRDYSLTDKPPCGSPPDKSSSGSPPDKLPCGSPPDNSPCGSPPDKSPSSPPPDKSPCGSLPDKSPCGSPPHSKYIPECGISSPISTPCTPPRQRELPIPMPCGTPISSSESSLCAKNKKPSRRSQSSPKKIKSKKKPPSPPSPPPCHPEPKPKSPSPPPCALYASNKSPQRSPMTCSKTSPSSASSPKPSTLTKSPPCATQTNKSPQRSPMTCSKTSPSPASANKPPTSTKSQARSPSPPPCAILANDKSPQRTSMTSCKTSPSPASPHKLPTPTKSHSRSPSLPPCATLASDKSPQHTPMTSCKTSPSPASPHKPTTPTKSQARSPSLPPSATQASNKSPQLGPMTSCKTSPSPASPHKPPTPTELQGRSPSLPPCASQASNKSPQRSPTICSKTSPSTASPHKPQTSTKSQGCSPTQPPCVTQASNKSPQRSHMTCSKISPSTASPHKPRTPTKSHARSPSPPRKQSTLFPPCDSSSTPRKRPPVQKNRSLCSQERVTSTCSPPTPPIPKSPPCLDSLSRKSPPCLQGPPSKSPPSLSKSPPCPGVAESKSSPKQSCESCNIVSQEFPWPLKNQNSNQSINSCSKSRESIPQKVYSFIKPDFSSEYKKQYEEYEEQTRIKNVTSSSKLPCDSLPKISGIYIKRKTSNKASSECVTTQTSIEKKYQDVNGIKGCHCSKINCPYKVNKDAKNTNDIEVSKEPVKVRKPRQKHAMQNEPSDDNIIIKIKKKTDSIEDIREGINLKVQDIDGKTLYERREYTIKDSVNNNKKKTNFENVTINQRRPSLLNDMYKNSHVHVVSTSRQVQNEESEQNSKIYLDGVKSEASVANLVVINFKLKIFTGDKTTEFNIGTDEISDKPKYETKSQTDQASQQVYLKDEAEQCTEDFNDKNDINIKIVIKNYKPKNKNKRYSEDYSQNISEKMNTVSTGNSDIISENRQSENADNVFSVHRATVDLASSNEVSKTQISTKDITSQECIARARIVTTSYRTTEISAIEHSESKEDLPSKVKSEDIQNLNYEKKPANYSSMTDTDEQDPESDLANANDELRINHSVNLITTALTRDEKKSLLKKVFAKAARVKKIKNKEKRKQIKDILKLILSDSSDHEVIAITSNELAKEMTYASLKPNYFRGTDSMNNYYKMESSVVSLKHGNHEPTLNLPTANISQCSVKDSGESSYEEDKPEPCICSALAAKLNGGGCYCKNPPKANEETFCDLRTEEDFLLLNYKTIEYIDVETQNSKYFCNSNTISVHSKAVSGSFRNSIEVHNVKNEETATRRDNNVKSDRKNYPNCIGHRQPCELKQFNRNTMLGISDEDEVYLINAKPTDVSIVSDLKMARRDVLENMKCRKRTFFAKYERPADLLQCYETKKAVLEIYAKSTKSDGERLVAKLPKFVYGNESAIESSYGEYAKICMR